MNVEFWWYVVRASGIVAAVLVVLTILGGLAISTRVVDRRGMPAWLLDLHRAVGGLSVAFIALHLGALVADNYLDFTVADILIPFASAYERGPVAWGVLAMWGLVAVEGSSVLVRRHPRKGWWRSLHYLSFPVGGLVVVHAVTAGTDSGHIGFLVGSLLLLAAAAFLVVFRLLGGRPRPTRTPVPTATNGAPVGSASSAQR